MKSWVRRHLQVFFYTLGQFRKNYTSSLMTFFVLGIGLSLPIILFSMIDGFLEIGGQWQSRPQITLYLDKTISDNQTSSLEQTLRKDVRFGDVNYISAKQGLETLSQQFDFNSAIDLLDTNPLPAVFVVYPKKSNSAEHIRSLTQELGKLEGVNSAQYDFEWLQKLNELTHFIKTLALLLGVIISFGIILVIANTIRLEISIRKDEITIIDRLGGTASFITRPFIYLGMLEGLFGGFMAILIAAIILKLLSYPLLKLAASYGFEYHFLYVRSDVILLVLLVSGALGWLAAKFTVLRHLNSLQAN